MKQTKNIVMMIALAIVGALTVGCTNDDNIIVDENPAAARTVILTTTVGFADTPAETRALTAAGVKTFAKDEKVAVIYTKSDGTTKAVAEYTIQDADIHNSGKAAYLSFSLTDPMDGNSDVTFVYPAFLADKDATDGISMAKLQSGQDGTLTKLSSDFDAATDTRSMTVSGTTATLPTGATLTNQLCIGQFTIKEGSTDITNKLVRLIVSDGANRYEVNRKASAGPIYVAMKPITSTADVTVSATDGLDYYAKTVTDKTLSASKIYPINVTTTKTDDRATPLTLEAKAAGTITFKNMAAGDVTYKINGTSLADYTIAAGSSKGISVTAGQKVTFYGDNATYRSSSSDYSTISCTADCYIYGNIMSLISSEHFATTIVLTGNNTFFRLFSSNKYIQNHPSNALVLPATTLADDCYDRMFYGCSGLTTAPALPAKTLTNGCYSNMFYNCTGLTSAPALPATALAGLCYYCMFSGCTSLTTAPALPAETLATNCYSNMFRGCASLTTAPALPAEALADYCYQRMFQGCTSLTTAPTLPAETLNDNCYESMFQDCTGLTTAPVLPATTLTYCCYRSMFYGCTKLETAPELPAGKNGVGSLAERCYSFMFTDCASLTTAPVLPAETLAKECYSNMFCLCSKLSSVTCLATDISANNCLISWLSSAGTDASITKRTLHVKSGQASNDWNVITTGSYAWTVVGDQ